MAQDVVTKVVSATIRNIYDRGVGASGALLDIYTNCRVGILPAIDPIFTRCLFFLRLWSPIFFEALEPYFF
jgi:hypothetical protein